MDTITSMEYLQVYTPQKLIKNWLGFRFVPDKEELKRAEEALCKEYPKLIRIDRPRAGVDNNEDFHVTMAWGIEPSKLPEAAQFLQGQKLTKDDLKLKTSAVQLLLSQSKTTVFVLLNCDESQKFKTVREKLIKEFLPPTSTWQSKPAHVTAMYGMLSDEPVK